ncbi:hypothetical protein ALC62_08633 [Cyphomyrmex costatus]|uniref:DUF4806 domain-containing protein n=1 Tax=Cyphomyrmex costatus TaxID=456900 RepID=A0A151IGM0_9HYME|nr:hypothetical protein ALC62_08633 [Cyphomyrmex costatus]
MNGNNSNDEIIDNANTESDNLDSDGSSNFLLWLQNWAIKNDISHVALTELMTHIKPKYAELPTDARSLLRTPRKINVQSIPPGYYYHFGLRNCIEKLVSRCSKNLQSIRVNINVDGLPLFKSSSSQVYPILCNLMENYSEVNVVGIYYGNRKPEDANLFLQAFTEEAINFTLNGIKINGSPNLHFYQINGHNYAFKINAFICDVLAKAFIKYTKGHSGYYSCNKYHDFRLKSQKDHHTGTSILETIPNLDMVKDFPSDPMHLLYLGIVKALVVNMWCYGKPRCRLSFNQMLEVSASLTKQKCRIPCEINRKPRSLIESKRWKATELRTFVLYTGPVVLRSVLNTDKYVNFLVLHVAVTILSNSKHMELYLDYAKSLLKYFVQTIIILYGKEKASHNVHNLFHLCDDVLKFGTLQEFSAFPFKNYLQKILKIIRKNEKPLEQIVCHISEQNSCAKSIDEFRTVNREPQLQNLHFNGPIVNNVNSNSKVNQYNKIVFEQYILKTTAPDNICCLIDGTIIIVQNFISTNEGTFVIGNKYHSLTDFYSEPCASSKLGIYVVDDIRDLQKWDVKQIGYKCLKLKFKDQNVVFPLLHSK